MNKYEVEVTMVIEASNKEAAEDIIRDILESSPELVSFNIDEVLENV